MSMRLEVYDIEAFKRMFYYLGYDIDTQIWRGYTINEFENDIYALVKHLKDGNIDYGISFNGVNYDSQILQYIVDNHQRWTHLGNLDIVWLIKKFSNKVIDDSNYGLFPPYREEDIDIKQIDLFRIHHFDNENRGTSLKWLQFSMDFHNVEETPVPFEKDSLTREDCEIIKDYCKNDVESTFEFYKYTIGEVSHSFYKGRNKIQDRLDIIEEMKFPAKAMNWSDVKIGDEINKKAYIDITGTTERQIKDLRKNRKSTSGFTYGKCIPPHVNFKTKEFNAFFDRMKKVRVNLREKESYPFSYNGTHYVVAKGGLHSNEKNRVIIPKPNEICKDADVGSQYPNFIIKRGLFPNHLGKAWLVGYSGTRDKRLDRKSRIEENPRFIGVSEMLKLSLNGGGFGKTNDPSNWQFDPFVQFSCTIGNQFEILMLIEEMEINGIHVISANTDGIVCLFDRSLNDKYHEICRRWELIVGNDVNGKLEFTEYNKLYQTSVNDYLAITTKGKVKKKGDFGTDVELNKNKSRRIIALALEKYFVDGIPVEKTITSHPYIFDFCVGVKASKKYHYETISKTGEKTMYDRMIRYYISKNGHKLIKVLNEGIDEGGVDMSQCEAGHWRCTIANQIDKDKNIEEYAINYDYYIEKANERVRAIESGRKKGKGGSDDPNQISLF